MAYIEAASPPKIRIRLEVRADADRDSMKKQVIQTALILLTRPGAKREYVVPLLLPGIATFDTRDTKDRGGLVMYFQGSHVEYILKVVNSSGNAEAEREREYYRHHLMHAKVDRPTRNIQREKMVAAACGGLQRHGIHGISCCGIGKGLFSSPSGYRFTPFV